MRCAILTFAAGQPARDLQAAREQGRCLQVGWRVRRDGAREEIAGGVVYNAARVSLSERSRELASLRVLGFTRFEISAILLGELGARRRRPARRPSDSAGPSARTGRPRSTAP